MPGVVHRIHVSDGGVPKLPVDAADIGLRGVAGDRQQNRKHHGAPWQALCLWSLEVIQELQEHSPQDIDRALERAHQQFKAWRASSFGQRASVLQAAARVLRADKARWAGLITAEMGKPIVEAEAEIEKCAWNCDFYAEHGPKFLADEHVETDAH